MLANLKANPHLRLDATGTELETSLRVRAGIKLRAELKDRSFALTDRGLDLAPARVTDSLDEKLEASLRAAKRIVSDVAMYMTSDFRAKVLRQLETLLDPENWDESDVIPSEESVRTFVRTIVAVCPERRPGLGLSNNGRLIALWKSDAGRLTLEFIGKDRVRWAASHVVLEERETGAGESTISRLGAVLDPYGGVEALTNGA